MTAEGSTGAPLRQQIAEAIHATGYDCLYDAIVGPCEGPNDHLTAADAVVALLNLTEEEVDFHDEGPTTPLRHRRYVTPWLPSTPPDTSSSETT